MKQPWEYAGAAEELADLRAEVERLKAERKEIVERAHVTPLRIADALQQLADELREDVEFDSAALEKP